MRVQSTSDADRAVALGLEPGRDPGMSRRRGEAALGADGAGDCEAVHMVKFIVMPSAQKSTREAALGPIREPPRVA